MSVDYAALYRALRGWVTAGSGLGVQSVYWGQQDSTRVPEPAIELRLYSEHPLGLPWLDTETYYPGLAAIAVTAVTPGTSVVTAPGHGLATGDGPIRFSSSGTLPAGLRADQDYWVLRQTNHTFRIAASYVDTGGPDIHGHPSGQPIVPVMITDTGAGTITITGTRVFQRAGQEIRYTARSINRLALMMECHTTAAVGMNAAMSVLGRVKNRAKLPGQQALLAAARLALTEVERPRAIHGVRNALLFEPRALMEVYFALPTEEVEFGGIIERAELVNRRTRRRFTV